MLLKSNHPCNYRYGFAKEVMTKHTVRNTQVVRFSGYQSGVRLLSTDIKYGY